MRLADYAIKHPVTIVMLILLSMLLGAVSLSRLSIDLLPEMNFPVAAVYTVYEGAGPEEIENLVTRPLEETLGTVNNVESISSTTSSGVSLVIIEFNWNTNMDFATLQMREKLDLIRRILPAEAGSPLVFKFDPSMMPVMQIGMGGSDDLAAIKKFGSDVVKGRLERLDGVASVSISGGLDRVIQVNLHPEAMYGYGISTSSVVQALAAQNLNLPGGTIEDGRTELLLRTVGIFQSVEEIAQIPIMSTQGFIVRLGDVAEVKDDYRDQTQFAFMNGEPSVSISIQKQTNANTVRVARLVKQELVKLNAETPAITYNTIFDQSVFVERSISVLTNSALYGGFLAVLVLFLFLRSFRTTMIIGISIPISIITTFILIHFAGLTLNMLSLGGLALGVGMLVDNAIVVLESIFRYRQEGYPPIEAAQLGSKEVGTAIIASTLTTVVVFLPVVYVQGLASIIFKELALTVIFSLLMSLTVSLTLIPMLSSRMLRGRPRVETKAGMYLRLVQWYQKQLRWALRHRKVFVAIGVLLFVLGAAMVTFIGAEFLPTVDQGRLSVSIRLPAGSRLTDTHEIAEKVAAIVRTVPELDTIFMNVGSGGLSMMGGSSSPNRATVDVKLVTLAERDRRTSEVVEELRGKIALIPGAEFNVRETDMMMMGGGFGGDPIVVKIKGDDLDLLKDLAEDSVARIEAVPGTREVSSSVGEGRPEMQIIVERDKAATMGMTVYQAALAIRSALSGQTATRYKVSGDEIDVVVQLEPESIQVAQDLMWLPVTTPLGTTVPLSDIATFKYDVGPISIAREGQSRIVEVSVDVFGRDLNSVTKEIQGTLAELNLPEGYSIEYGGQNQEMWDAFGNLAFAFVLALVLVYMVMASQFESLVHPLTIMFSVPFALVGVTMSLAITGRTINVASVIGIIMLAGIVVNNAIVLVDYINQLRENGEERTTAIINAGGTRLRPILMTTLTTVLALFPMALGIGAGAELLAPLSTVVIGGLVASTLLTLFIVPVTYSIFDDLGRRWDRTRKAIPSEGRDGTW